MKFREKNRKFIVENNAVIIVLAKMFDQCLCDLNNTSCIHVHIPILFIMCFRHMFQKFIAGNIVFYEGLFVFYALPLAFQFSKDKKQKINQEWSYW